MSNDQLPEWERLLSCAAQLQKIIPDAVLVGGTAAALYATHRYSHDADHVITNLRGRFDEILATLESVAGWKTARTRRPVLILGSLDGIETGVRQLIREQPLETTKISAANTEIVVPTEEEMLRIKAALILQRNATRDYLDFIALANHLGADRAVSALLTMDMLYPQPGGNSALQQLQIQLANPLPFDLEGTSLAEYHCLSSQWHSWEVVKDACSKCAAAIMDRLP